MREKVNETMQISADISLPACLQLSPEVCLPVSGSFAYLHYKNVRFNLYDICAGNTKFNVALEMEVELPKDLTEEELTQLLDFKHRINGPIFIPYFDLHCFELESPGFVLYRVLQKAVWKLGFVADDLRCIRALDYKSMNKYVGPITISCKGRSATSEMPPDRWQRFADSGPMRPGERLTQAQVQLCLSSPLEDFEEYCIFSDMEYPRGRLDIAVVMLVTMLETEAYKTAKRIAPAVDPEDFNPRLYFGDKNYLKAGVPLFQGNADCYRDCHELWGSRHEIVHNGQNKVRKFNGTHGVDKRNLREISGREIKYFRQAALSAIDWMRQLP